VCYYSRTINDEVRDAVQGDKLTLTNFPHTHVFCELPNRDCAVCIPGGAVLTLSNIAQDVRVELGINETERVTFIEGDEQVDVRDRVLFSHGATATLDQLNTGVLATVDSLVPVPIEEPVLKPVLRRPAKRRIPVLASYIAGCTFSIFRLFI
jgi:hypothetical protein